MRRAARRQALALGALLALAAAAAQGAVGAAPDPGTELLIGWYELQRDMARETPGHSPPVVARALAYSGVAAWEALAPSLPDGVSLAGQLEGLAPLPRPDLPYDGQVAVNVALAATLRGLYPSAFAEHLARVDQREAEVTAERARTVVPAALEASQRYGRAVADAVLRWAEDDGGSEGYLGGVFDYTPAEGPAAWVPTPRRNGPPLPPLLTTWGRNRPLVLPAADACRAPPPPAYSAEPGSDFYQAAYEVYDRVRSLTPEQEAIALFWSDDAGQTSTPAGHWISILGQVLRQQGTPLAVAAEAYARLGIAANDAFISCWSTKFTYSLVRPITYIRRVIDPRWNVEAITDPVVTPPFPEYTSGHSVVSGAVAATLTGVFGTLPFVDHTHDRRGQLPRSFDSFAAAAEEAALSRLYGGIHYRFSIERGLAEGRCVAERVATLVFRR